MNKFLIIAIFAAALIIGGAVMYVKTGATPGPVAPPVDTTACATGDQCIVVDTNCGFCCDYLAINANHEQSFNQSFDKKCSRYSGEFCKCFDLSSYPSCVEGQCQLIKWPD